MTLFVAPHSPSETLRQRIEQVVRGRSANTTRSKQVPIGPSEAGDACLRKLAYRKANVPKQTESSDPWPSVSGTAIHAWLADAFGKDNNSDWLIEHRVTITETMAGTVDLFDISNGIVIDHKCVGASSMKKVKAEGPSEQQIAQIMLYGFGLQQAGYEVKSVALAFYPLGGMLTGLHVWLADYDFTIAEKAIDRLDNLDKLLALLSVEQYPERWAAIPASPSWLCGYCPFHIEDSQDLGTGCPGK